MKLLLLFLFANHGALAADYVLAELAYQTQNTPYHRGRLYSQPVYMNAFKYDLRRSNGDVFCGLGGFAQTEFEGDKSSLSPSSEIPWCVRPAFSKDLLPIPKLWLATHLSVAADGVCALDQMGVHCWHYDGAKLVVEEVPALTRVRVVSRGRNFACALAQEGVRCWGDNSKGQLNVPPLRNPTQMSAGMYHACALADEGVKCWGDNSYGQLDVPALNNPNAILAGFGMSCVREDLAFTCWGRDANLVDNVYENKEGLCLSFPNGTGGDRTNSCVSRFKWLNPGVPSTYGWPDFNLDQLAPLAEYLEKISTPARARYFFHLRGYLEGPLSSRQRLHALSLSRYLMAKLMSAAMVNVDSDYYKKTFLPGYFRSMNGIEEEIGLTHEASVPDSVLSRTVALQVMRASFATLNEVLGEEDRKLLLDAQRELGQALASPMDQKRIQALLARITLLAPIWNKIEQQPKFAFLANSVLAADRWLRQLGR